MENLIGSPGKLKFFLSNMGCVQSKKYQPYCPNCNSNENVIEIIYGYPTEEGMEDFRHGLKHLGGCGFDSRSPDSYCKKCKRSFNGKIQ